MVFVCISNSAYCWEITTARCNEEKQLLIQLGQTVRSKSFMTDFFKNRRHTRKTHNFFKNKNKLHWHIYKILRGSTVSEKLPTIPLFVPSVIHQLRLLGRYQIPVRIYAMMLNKYQFGSLRTRHGKIHRRE